MKKILIIAVLSLCMTTAAQATLMQGEFSGVMNFLSPSAVVSDGALFTGSFLYDDETSSLYSLSVTLFGVDEEYTFDYTDYDNPSIGLSYWPGQTQFESIPGQHNFIGDEGVRWAEFSLFPEGTSIVSLFTTVSYHGYISSTALTTHAAPIPEPATMLLFSSGIAGLVASKRKKQKE